MGFIDFKEFKQLYKLDRVIYNENENTIYDEGEYIVKDTQMFGNFLIELNFYQYFNHPCIMKIIHYTYNNNTFYFSSRKGENIIDAYIENKITIEEIASDLISAITFLHSNGVGHFDIKEDNIIYLDGKAMLIDFELTEKCDMYYTRINNKETEDYYCRENIGFTEGWRDPEFSLGHHVNSVRSDYYALGMTLYDIYVRGWKNRNISVYYPDLDKIKNENLKDFIKRCEKIWKNREEIYKHPIIVRKYNGSIQFKKYKYIHKIYNDDDEALSYYIKLVEWIFDVFETYNIDAKTAFRVIHLMQYMLNKEITNFIDEKDKLQLIGVCCAFLIFNFDGIILTLKDVKSLCDNAYSMDQILKMSFNILKNINGILSFNTHFDVAQNAYQLSTLFDDTIKPSYDPEITSDITEMESHFEDDTKFISFIKLRSNWFIKHGIMFTTMNQKIQHYKHIPQDVIKYKIYPMKLPKVSIDKYKKSVRNIINNNNYNDYGIILQNDDYIYKLNPDELKQFNDAMKKTMRRGQLRKNLHLPTSY